MMKNLLPWKNGSGKACLYGLNFRYQCTAFRKRAETGSQISDKKIRRCQVDTAYEEISQEDSQYKLLIMDVNAEPKEYWTCIFKYVSAREDFWICLNM